jgi:diguanylate cyclase (GGDEF)-like protein
VSGGQNVVRPMREGPFAGRWLPAVATFCLMLMIGAYAMWQSHVIHQGQVRAQVLQDVSLIRAKLEGNLGSSIQLARGLVATLSTEPNMDQARFGALASRILANDTHLRNVAAAPDLVVQLMYPIAGNERAIGLDYRSNEAQYAAAARARDAGELVLAGPVDLVQGGQGLIGRFPVFVDEAGSGRRFWGIVSAVIDLERLYEDSGLNDSRHGLDIALVGRDGLSIDGEQFYGTPAILGQNPVAVGVVLPSGSWRIAAIPKGGWPTFPPDAPWLALGFLVLAFVVSVPIAVAGGLLEERKKHVVALKSRETELARLSRRLELALETSQVGVFDLDLATGELIWDDRVNALFGLPEDGGVRNYSHWRNALHPEDVGRAEEEFRVATEFTGRYHSEYRIVTPGGDVRNIRAIGAVYAGEDGGRKIAGVNWDVSADVRLNDSLKEASRLSEVRNAELELAKASIEYNAMHDALTGLPNRRYLDHVLSKHGAKLGADASSLALLHIDLDRFKQINDTLGHAAGDAMLVHVSQVLARNLQGKDFAARIGGDEFVVVSGNDVSEAGLARQAERIIAQIRRPITYQGHECRCGVSIGIASEVGVSVDPARLLINADIALYRAKSRGRNRYEFFSEELQAEAVRTKRVADEILNGLEKGEFLPYYQPLFDAHTLDIVGVEALARWRHPIRGILAPSEFLDVAEDLNVVQMIDRLILEQALADHALWRTAGHTVPKIAVNVSFRRLQDEQLIDTLRPLRFEPGTLAFELVESIFLDKTDDVVSWNVDQIKELGIDIEIDDFGTGYASIVSLMKLKPKRLKIDRQLIEPIVNSEAQRKLVGSIVEIGRSLGIQVVGEGVETWEHANILRDLGCASLQGYALARPMAHARFMAFLEERASTPSVESRRRRLAGGA